MDFILSLIPPKGLSVCGLSQGSLSLSLLACSCGPNLNLLCDSYILKRATFHKQLYIKTCLLFRCTKTNCRCIYRQRYNHTNAHELYNSPLCIRFWISMVFNRDLCFSLTLVHIHSLKRLIVEH